SFPGNGNFWDSPMIVFCAWPRLKDSGVFHHWTDTVGSSNDRACATRFVAASHCWRAATISGFPANASEITPDRSSVFSAIGSSANATLLKITPAAIVVMQGNCSVFFIVITSTDVSPIQLEDSATHRPPRTTKEKKR